VTAVRLEARGLVKRYAGVHAVDGVDLVAEPGSIAALVGPNGAGKTTLFDLLSGVERPDAGTVWLGGRDVTRMGSDARSRLGMARTFQHSSVFPSLTVRENLLVGAENRHRTGVTLGMLGVVEPQHRSTEARARAIASRLGLAGILDAPAATLSTGRLRLVELGRALCTLPDVLLLDEPASGLDDDETEELQRVLRSLATDGITLVLVEHDLALVRDTADAVHVMGEGRVVASGPPDVVAGARPR
jgi:branched-chain amino acid transport system ATP-binding protein